MTRANPTLSALSPRNDIFIVLCAPGIVHGIDVEALLDTLKPVKNRIRLLIYETDLADLALAAPLKDAEIETEWLLSHAISPVAGMRFVQMPQDSSCEERESFALAMADIVIEGRDVPREDFLSKADKLGKLLVVPGQTIDFPPSMGGMTRLLDPELSRWNNLARPFFGRLEQLFLELLGMDWFDWRSDSFKESCKCIGKVCSLKWTYGPYFAPLKWEESCPDSAALDPSTPIRVAFDTLDRGALFGSYVHRDLVWVVHFTAAFAVFSAVAGVIWPLQAWGIETWAIFELLSLLIVLMFVLLAKLTELQDRWIACRLGAEQLRIARMCLPLLVIPPALSSVDKRPESPNHPAAKSIIRKLLSFRRIRKAPDYMLQALTEFKRAVREQGLPVLEQVVTFSRLAEWLKVIVEDQLHYHQRNHHKLERAERKLLIITSLIFICAIFAVIVHLFELDVRMFHRPLKELLLFTASGPAFAAAVHGAGTRLGIVHRSALSADAAEELKTIQNELAGLLKEPASEQTWQRLRGLALRAADAMGRENTSWHGLVRRERDGLPA